MLKISYYDGIKYPSTEFIARDLDFFGNGALNLSDFPLTFPATPNMTVQVGAGTAWIDGFRIANDMNLVTLTVLAASSQPRIDIIQIGHDDINKQAVLMVKQGVPGSSPVEPGADAGYVKLYAISVGANVSSISSGNITDRRSLVPLKVTGSQISYQGVPTQAQFDAKFDPATGHKHTGAAGDAPKIDTSGLANAAVTDVIFGNRTVDDTATPNTGPNSPTNLFSFFGKMIRQITGESSWITAPAVTIKSLLIMIGTLANLNTSYKTDLVGSINEVLGMPVNSISRQAIINPDFEVCQNGTSFAGTGSAVLYLADQWYQVNSSNATFEKRTDNPFTGSRSYARVTATALGGFFNFAQPFEKDTCDKLKGRPVSLSFVMSRDITYDGSYRISIEKNAVADTAAGTWTTIASVDVTPTTTWATYKLENVLIPSDANGLRIQFAALGGTRPLNSYVNIGQVQHNVGATTLPFNAKSEQMEKLSCQHFYEKSNPVFDNNAMSLGYAEAANFITFDISYKVTKRTAPTIKIYDNTGTINKINAAATGRASIAGVATIAYQGIEGSFVITDNIGTLGNHYLCHWVADARL